MYDKKIIDQINKILSVVEVEEKKYLSALSESEKLNKKISELKEKMRISPSFEVTQELGNLESGKKFFEESIATFKSNYKQALTSQYKKAKSLADSLIRQSTIEDQEISNARQKLIDALKNVSYLNLEVDRIHEEKRNEAFEAIQETKLIHYASEYGEYYSKPFELGNPNTLGKKLSDGIEIELSDK